MVRWGHGDLWDWYDSEGSGGFDDVLTCRPVVGGSRQ